MSAWKRKLLFGTWIASFGVALLCLGVFVQGLLRDHRAGVFLLVAFIAAVPLAAEGRAAPTIVNLGRYHRIPGAIPLLSPAGRHRLMR